jgi:hypothetical protein
MIDPATGRTKSVTESFWNARRSELREWLRRNAPSLGELYEGVLVLLHGNPPIPGWPRFIAHGMREIGNRLPDALGGARKNKQLQYKNQVDGIAKLWRKSGLPVATADSLTSTSIPTQPTADVAVPRVVFRKLQILVEEHLTTREKPVEAAGRLFASFSPDDGDANTRLAPIISEWVAIIKWFQQQAHDRLVSDDSYERAEFQARFEQAERILMALVRDFFKTTEELDDILEDTNS